MKARVREVVTGMRGVVGGEKPAVESTDPFKVLIATILSARTRDENTMRVAEELFDAYDTPEDIAKAPLARLEKLVHASGFFKVKAARIRNVSAQIMKDFGGRVPDDIDELLKLDGVGRKTANCVLVYAYHKPAIPVDVHVHRISNRLGWVKTKTPDETEAGLSRIVPKRYWIELNNLMVKYGRRVCLPRNPRCGECVVRKHCECVGV